MLGVGQENVASYVATLVFTVVLSVTGAVGTIAFLANLNGAVHGAAADLAPRLLWSGGLLLVAVGASFTGQALLARLSYAITHDIRMSVARSVAYAPLERIDSFGVQRILTILIDDINSLVQAIVYLPQQVSGALMVTGGLIYLFYLDGLIGAGVAIGVVLMMVLGARATLSATEVMLRGRFDDEELRRFISQLVYGAKEVKLNPQRRRNLLERDILAASRSAADNYIRCMHMYRSFDEIVKVLYFTFFLAALSYAAVTPKFGVAGTGAVIIIFYFLQGPIQAVNFSWERIAPARIAFNKLRVLYAELASSPPSAPAAGAPAFGDWSEIRLEGVGFTYPDAAGEGFAVGPIDATIRRGQLIFIRGENGAGKTTLSKVLSGLYRPTTGRITVDGTPVADTDSQSYRELFTVLFADKHLFDEVCPGDGVTEADVVALLADLRIPPRVTVNDWRFSTIDLSTGQRDRLALVDSIAQRRPIAIFDEWAANQDPASRARFYQELLPRFIRAGQTVIVISHDDRYYDRADRLWTVDAGRVLQEAPALEATS